MDIRWAALLGASLIGCAAGAPEPAAGVLEPAASTAVPPAQTAREASAGAAAEAPQAAGAPSPEADATAAGSAAAGSAATVASGEGEEAVPGAPRLTSQAYLTWVWAKPKVKGRFLGTIRVGDSVALRDAEKVVGQGCARGFFRVEPRGYVCHDRTVTLAGDTPFLRAVADSLPRAGAFPYRWALSNGAPMYTRVPTPAEQKRVEWRYGPAGKFTPLSLFQRGHEHLATTDPIEPSDPRPAFLRDGGSARGKIRQLLRRTIPHGSMLSYTRAFDVDGRTFLLSADLTVVPADRVRKFRPSAFRGVHLGRSVALPLGWIRGDPKPRYRRTAAGAIEPTGKQFPLRSWLRLTGQTVTHDGRSYHQVQATKGARGGQAGGTTVTAEAYAATEDLSIASAVSKRPFGIPEGIKWLDISITAGTLVAYEDLRPVYATLVSPGQGGVPIKGRDHVKYSTTPLGSYRITFKDRAGTMSPEMGENRSFWIADVPFTQYFNPPFALHGAYWHEKFGEPMSAGCINASPIDAAFLFDWTDPPVPPGWQGATGAGAKENGTASIVRVRR